MRTLASQITRCPRIFTADQAQDARALFPDAPPEIAALVAGAGSTSPYLLGLMQKETDWCRVAFDDPAGAVQQVIDSAGAVPPDQLSSHLRQGKRRVALMTGLADLAGAW